MRFILTEEESTHIALQIKQYSVFVNFTCRDSRDLYNLLSTTYFVRLAVINNLQSEQTKLAIGLKTLGM